MLSITLIAGLLTTLQFADAGQGTVNAYGCVYCKGKALKDIMVKMYDVDNVIDAFMGKTRTDNDGCFFVNGTATDLRDEIDPVINFYHTCDMGIDYGRCLLKSRLFLDSAETVNTPKPVNFTKIDVANLPTGKDCIH
ncbi:Transthyretin-like family protein [Oesophagostomum dentatum]|uniref:Transthyretin-like family protein n=1 Tax=Oesophagostomum dentatum TaxID=61180 RepID=A0A0B1SMV3_OESDE|nr:Transthyretin-like family protein [Oesophagostomum dentatum]